MTEKTTVYLPFDVLSDSKSWSVGTAYRVKLVLKQTSVSEDGASFEVIDASSREPNDKEKKRFLTSEGGYIKT